MSDRLTLNWSGRHCLVWAGGRSRMRTVTLDTDSDDDIAVVMQRRAGAGYGGDQSYQITDDEELRLAWSWCSHVTDLVTSGHMRQSVRSGVRCPGVRSVLRSGHSTQQRSVSWSGKQVVTYTSPAREAVLRLCGWRGDHQSLSLTAPADHLSSSARQAAVAIFNLDLRRALQELQTGATLARSAGDSELSNVLSMVSVAVSGYPGDTDTDLWRDTVSASLSSLPHPALRAIFSFLTSRDAGYSSVLEEQGLLLVDRLGFAVTFLDDAGLESFIEREWEGLLSAGRLEGLVISGGDDDGVQLLQRYVDRTGDVQSVSWLSVRMMSVEQSKNDQVLSWLESYRY